MSKESVEAVLKRVKEAQPKVEVVANSQVTAPIEGCGDGNGLQVDAEAAGLTPPKTPIALLDDLLLAFGRGMPVTIRIVVVRRTHDTMAPVRMRRPRAP